jgi:hypothetical protein
MKTIKRQRVRPKPEIQAFLGRVVRLDHPETVSPEHPEAQALPVGLLEPVVLLEQAELLEQVAQEVWLGNRRACLRTRNAKVSLTAAVRNVPMVIASYGPFLRNQRH